ncbi:hypothetical protein KBC86_04605 [Candidatus Gracilibacteria bacterium]|nr:hypothetical protein [Candidatus Gracilibacteria bacterium]
MSNIQLSSYSRETLEHLLKIVKSYRSGLKQIGKRAKLEDPNNPIPIRAIVELHPSLDEKDGVRYAEAVIHSVFPTYTGESPLIRKNDELKGGARVFVGDDMVDVTMQKFESLLK